MVKNTIDIYLQVIATIGLVQSMIRSDVADVLKWSSLTISVPIIIMSSF